MKRLAILFWTFFWISSVVMGGGMAMLPVLEREFVDRRGWLTSEEMLDVVAVMQSLPGLIIINMAVLIGYRVKGVLGALVSAVGAVVTPYVVIAFAARCLLFLSDNPTLDHVFLGIRAGTAALIALSLVKLAKSALVGRFAQALAVLSFVAAVVLQVDLTYVVLGGFAVGVALVVANALRRAKG